MVRELGQGRIVDNTPVKHFQEICLDPEVREIVYGRVEVYKEPVAGQIYQSLSRRRRS